MGGQDVGGRHAGDSHVGDVGGRHAGDSHVGDVGGRHAGDKPVEARKKAMDFLARREHGRAELISKLCRSGFEPDIADEAVAGLVADGLQSDARFVEAMVAARINQGKGPLRISADLRESGIADAEIARGLEAAGHDWCTAAIEVRQKKFGGRRPADFKEKARQMRFLQSRGFDADQIQAAVSAPTE